jgi:phenylalanyl-tRNA synthetase beta chain
VLQTRALPGGWRSEPQGADFFTARAVLEAVLEVSQVAWRADPEAQPFLHPGRSAAVIAGETDIGWVGELHPLVAAEWELAGPTAGFEIDMDAVEQLGQPQAYRDVSSFPAVLQDIAVVVGEDVSAVTVIDAIRSAGEPLLATVELFDVFRGEQVGAGDKSLALRLAFQAPDRTLTDAEVAAPRKAIEAALGEIGGRLRA